MSTASVVFDLREATDEEVRRQNRDDMRNGVHNYYPGAHTLEMIRRATYGVAGVRLETWLTHPDDRVVMATLDKFAGGIGSFAAGIEPGTPLAVLLLDRALRGVDRRQAAWSPLLDRLSADGLWPRVGQRAERVGTGENVEVERTAAAQAEQARRWIQGAGDGQMSRALETFESDAFLGAVARWRNLSDAHFRVLLGRTALHVELAENELLEAAQRDALGEVLVRRARERAEHPLGDTSHADALETFVQHGGTLAPEDVRHLARIAEAGGLQGAAAAKVLAILPQLDAGVALSTARGLLNDWWTLAAFLLRSEASRAEIRTLALAREDGPYVIGWILRCEQVPADLLAFAAGAMGEDHSRDDALAGHPSATPDVWRAVLEQRPNARLADDLAQKWDGELDAARVLAPHVREPVVRTFLSGTAGDRVVFRAYAARFPAEALDLLESGELAGLNELGEEDWLPLMGSSDRDVRVRAIRLAAGTARSGRAR